MAQAVGRKRRWSGRELEKGGSELELEQGRRELTDALGMPSAGGLVAALTDAVRSKNTAMAGGGSSVTTMAAEIEPAGA